MTDLVKKETILGKNYIMLGDASSDLILNGKGIVKVRWGDHFINLLKDGKVSSDAFKFSTVTVVPNKDSIPNADGFYYDSSTGDLYLRIGDILYKLKMDVAGSEEDSGYISYLIPQELTLEQIVQAYKNLKLVIDSETDVTTLPEGYVFFDTEKHVHVWNNNGVLQELYIPIGSSTSGGNNFNTQVNINTSGETSANEGDLNITGDNGVYIYNPTYGWMGITLDEFVNFNTDLRGYKFISNDKTTIIGGDYIAIGRERYNNYALTVNGPAYITQQSIINGGIRSDDYITNYRGYSIYKNAASEYTLDIDNVNIRGNLTWPGLEDLMGGGTPEKSLIVTGLNNSYILSPKGTIKTLYTKVIAADGTVTFVDINAEPEEEPEEGVTPVIPSIDAMDITGIYNIDIGDVLFFREYQYKDDTLVPVEEADETTPDIKANPTLTVYNSGKFVVSKRQWLADPITLEYKLMVEGYLITDEYYDINTDVSILWEYDLTRRKTYASLPSYRGNITEWGTIEYIPEESAYSIEPALGPEAACFEVLPLSNITQETMLRDNEILRCTLSCDSFNSSGGSYNMIGGFVSGKDNKTSITVKYLVDADGFVYVSYPSDGPSSMLLFDKFSIFYRGYVSIDLKKISTSQVAITVCGVTTTIDCVANTEIVANRLIIGAAGGEALPYAFKAKSGIGCYYKYFTAKPFNPKSNRPEVGNIISKISNNVNFFVNNINNKPYVGLNKGADHIQIGDLYGRADLIDTFNSPMTRRFGIYTDLLYSRNSYMQEVVVNNPYIIVGATTYDTYKLKEQVRPGYYVNLEDTLDGGVESGQSYLVFDNRGKKAVIDETTREVIEEEVLPKNEWLAGIMITNSDLTQPIPTYELPITLRDVTETFTNDHVIKWDAARKCIVDTGIDVADLATTGSIPTIGIDPVLSTGNGYISSLSINNGTITGTVIPPISVDPALNTGGYINSLYIENGVIKGTVGDPTGSITPITVDPALADTDTRRYLRSLYLEGNVLKGTYSGISVIGSEKINRQNAFVTSVEENPANPDEIANKNILLRREFLEINTEAPPSPWDFIKRIYTISGEVKAEYGTGAYATHTNFADKSIVYIPSIYSDYPLQIEFGKCRNGKNAFGIPFKSVIGVFVTGIRTEAGNDGNAAFYGVFNVTTSTFEAFIGKDNGYYMAVGICATIK